MKKIMILMVLALVLSACSTNNNSTDTVTDQKETASENVYEDIEEVEEDKTELVEEPELSDEEKIFAFLGGYIESLDYPVEESDLTILYDDITGNGQEDILVTISIYNAVALTRDQDTYTIIGIMELGKTLDNVAIEDGFIIYDIGLSGTGTGTNYKYIYKYDGSKVVLLESLAMAGYDAGGDISLAGELYFNQGYRSFTYYFKKIDIPGDLVLENLTAVYTYNDENSQYDVEHQVLISEDMNGIYLNELTLGQEIEGFVVDSLEYSDDIFNLVLLGNKSVKGKIGFYYNEMYDMDELYFVSDEPILDQVFFHQFKDDLEPDPYAFSISYGIGSHVIYNYDDLFILDLLDKLEDGQELEVQVQVTGLYAGGRFRSEGGQSISIGDVTILD